MEVYRIIALTFVLVLIDLLVLICIHWMAFSLLASSLEWGEKIDIDDTLIYL